MVKENKTGVLRLPQAIDKALDRAPRITEEGRLNQRLRTDV